MAWRNQSEYTWLLVQTREMAIVSTEILPTDNAMEILLKHQK